MKFQTIVSSALLLAGVCAKPIITEVIVNTIEVVTTATSTVTQVVQTTTLSDYQFA
ncbi:LAMI_0E15214g1_1 [Lachancea mirantina]|uniref:LAMI_0E15214g1_1 n=1 Tax=Lachancea mirantina TaxID=1230905 RepID=A0A1G4JSJ2_9SACH|nr:LAMI_0E15214g1_1 [Lachancea mirantina]